MHWYWAVVYKFDCRTSYQIEDGTALDQAFYSPVLNFRRTDTSTSWMIRACLKLFDVICYIVFENNFQSIDGLSMNLAIIMFQGTSLWIMYGKFIASLSCQERWKPPNRGEKWGNPQEIPWILGFFGNLPMMNLEAVFGVSKFRLIYINCIGFSSFRDLFWMSPWCHPSAVKLSSCIEVAIRFIVCETWSD